MGKTTGYRKQESGVGVRKIWVLLFIFVCLGFGGVVIGEVVTLEARGFVNEISEYDMELDGSVEIGTEIVARCSYDTNTADLNGDPWRGEYEISTVSMTVGNYTFSHNAESEFPRPAMFDIYVGDYCYYVYSNSARFDGVVLINGEAKDWENSNWGNTDLTVMDLRSSSNEYGLTDALPVSVPPFS